MNENHLVHLLIISGAVGVGKSKVADAISDVLRGKNISNAVIDLDCLRSAYPRPADDPFHMLLGYKNLASVWKNYKELGITHVIIPNVLESRQELEQFKLAIPNTHILVVRLIAKLETIHKRLEGREVGNSLTWHLNRAVELTEQLEQKKTDDVTIDTENKTTAEVAGEVLAESGWLKG